MKIRIIVILSVIWSALCIFGYIYFAQIPAESRSYTAFNSWTEDEDYLYISDNTSRGGVIYQYGVSDADKEKKGFASLFARDDEDSVGLPVNRMLTAWSNGEFNGYSFYKIVQGNYLYVVAGKPEIKENTPLIGYRIYALDAQLQPVKRSKKIALENGQKLSSLTADGTTIFLTTISADGQEAYTYQFLESEMESLNDKGGQEGDADGSIDVNFSQWSQNFLRATVGSGATKSTEAEADQWIKLRNIKIRSVEAGRYFAEAVYENGVIYTRYDDSQPDERFKAPADVEEVYENGGLSFTQRISVSEVSRTAFILAAVIGVGLFIAVPIIYDRRQRIVYVATVTELILLALIVGMCYFIISQKDRVRENSFDNASAYTTAGIANRLSLPSFANTDDSSQADYFYDSSVYLQLQRVMAEQVSLSQTGAGFHDICYLDLTDHTVYISASGRNRQSISSLYGEAADLLATDLSSTPNALIRTTTIQGQKYHIIGVHSQSTGTPGLGVIALADYDQSYGSFWENNLAVVLFSAILFLIGSFAFMVYLFLQNRDIRRLGSALRRLAAGGGDVDKPRVVGRDMNTMWNSIFEIDKNVRNANRSRYQIFEAYYRFAPKKIERILQKDSITEVHGGDAVKMNGTMALISTAGQRNANRVDIERMNHFLAMIEKHQESRDGIYVSNNGDLSKMKVLFIESAETISFGTELLYEMREWQQREYANATVMLHYAPFVYGVAGTQNQSSAFLASRETEELEDYMEWFRTMRLSLIITEAVKDREESLMDTRYIGFVGSTSNPEGKINLYEVLDANSTRIRQMKLKTRAQFEQSIQMFYRQDFYLARNAFTEILRDFPEDEMVTWYLFECEHYLNENADTSGFTGALHVSKRAESNR